MNNKTRRVRSLSGKFPLTHTLHVYMHVWEDVFYINLLIHHSSETWGELSTKPCGGDGLAGVKMMMDWWRATFRGVLFYRDNIQVFHLPGWAGQTPQHPPACSWHGPGVWRHIYLGPTVSFPSLSHPFSVSITLLIAAGSQLIYSSREETWGCFFLQLSLIPLDKLRGEPVPTAPLGWEHIPGPRERSWDTSKSSNSFSDFSRGRTGPDCTW